MNDLIPAPNVQLVADSGAPMLMSKIRPHWQAKALIQRVERLLDVDPSSACQRLFNAAIHDLREKIVIAGVDIAGEAALQFKLPPVSKEEDVENYPTAKLIDLAYKMGLFTRPEWRRVSRSYEIRRDLEHEDDEYEAGVEDCVYIFKTCIEVILAVDPINLLRIKDVKDIIEQAQQVHPGGELLDDFQRAPQPRQLEIMKFLVGISLDRHQPDVVQQNAYSFLSALKSRTADQVTLQLASGFQDRIGRGGLDERHARVAHASGAMPYLKQSARKDLFESYHNQLMNVGTNWGGHQQHGELLRRFSELGGFAACPTAERHKIVKWMVLTYIGTPGGRTSYGNVRPVFYSNTAAPIIHDIFKAEASQIREELNTVEQAPEVQQCLSDQHIARRFEQLKDLIVD